MEEIDTNILNRIKKVHFIGVGGIGMSGLAEYLASKQYEVSGSDMILSPITERLSGYGVKILEGHKAENLPDNADLVVYTAAVKEDNEEYKKAKSLKIQMMKRAQMLGQIVNSKYLIAVSGTHGKTTTTAMISKVFIDNGYDPTVFVGGSLDFLEGGTSRIGDSKYAIVEADEYDRSFHTLRPDIAIVTNIEYDHSDIYSSLEDIKFSFKKFLVSGKKESKIIACGDDSEVKEVVGETGNMNTFFYGTSSSNRYAIEDIKLSEESLTYVIDGKLVTLAVSGTHNILNSAAAYLAAKEVNIGFDGYVESIKNFTGVQRRLELKYNDDIKIYDDYAHHPTEVKATLQALSGRSKGKIITVFQPHLYSRTKDFYKDFASALKNSDVVILAEIYPAREKPIEGISSELIYKELKNIPGSEAYMAKDRNEIFEILDNLKQAGDTIVFMGAGNITDFCKEYVQKIKSSI